MSESPQRRPADAPVGVLRKDWRIRGIGFDRPVLRDRLFYAASAAALVLGVIVTVTSEDLAHGALAAVIAFPWIGVLLGSVREFIRGFSGRD